MHFIGSGHIPLEHTEMLQEPNPSSLDFAPELLGLAPRLTHTPHTHTHTHTQIHLHAYMRTDNAGRLTFGGRTFQQCSGHAVSMSYPDLHF